MVSHKFILETFTRQALLDIAQALDLSGLTAKRKDEVVAALSRSRRIDTEAILACLYRDDLKALCQAAGLDDSGRAKQILVDRLLGREREVRPFWVQPKAAYRNALAVSQLSRKRFVDHTEVH